MDDHRGYRQTLGVYRLGLVLAIILTLVPVLLVQWAGLSRGWTLASVLLLALAQIVVHFRCFLHVGAGNDAHRQPLYLLLFSSVIVLLMVGGTLLVFFDQIARM